MTTMAITEEQAAQANELDFYREIYDRRIWEYDVVSGAQIKVVLGDNVILEDATAIQFTLTQSKKPIFGYASQYFDAVAKGVVIVHGRVWINFIHQGYLRTLLDLARNSGSTDVLKAKNRQELESLEDLLRRGQRDQPLTDGDVVQYVRDENLKRVQQFAGNTMKRRPDIGKSVNIQIHYGDRSLARGVPLKVIYNVHFMGEGQDIQISGQPQQEWYEFLAHRVT